MWYVVYLSGGIQGRIMEVNSGAFVVLKNCPCEKTTGRTALFPTLVPYAITAVPPNRDWIFNT